MKLNQLSHEVLKKLLERGQETNTDGMPVVKWVDKDNKGCLAYLRYDAVIYEINAAIKQIQKGDG